MSDDAAPAARAPVGPPTLRQWDVFSQGLPSDPRGQYFRLLADPRPEAI